MSITSLFHGCTDSCGWVAAFVAALAYGTYGVPIKESLKQCENMDPLVFQSYKTVVMFVTCWTVLLMGVPARFTPWGLLSGLLWVLGGAGGIVAIRMAGMAVAVGTWSSVMIVVNFVWGILIFQEPVSNFGNTLCAFLLLAIGLVGMSHFSSPQQQQQVVTADQEDSSSDDEENMGEIRTSSFEEGLSKRDVGKNNITIPRSRPSSRGPSCAKDIPLLAGEREGFPITENMLQNGIQNDSAVSAVLMCSASERKRKLRHMSFTESDASDENENSKSDTESIVVFGIIIRKRVVGILGAVFNGLMTGSSLIPVHYAKKHGFGGANYMISYATGALISNIVIWLLVFMTKYFYFARQECECISSAHDHDTKNIRTTIWQLSVNSMPKLYLKEIWLTGVIAGVFLTVGMFSSLLSVTYLGQGIGNSVIQSKILISGMWGIFWYKEISRPRAVMLWFLSAAFTVSGIVWLSRERLLATLASDDSQRALLLQQEYEIFISI